MSNINHSWQTLALNIFSVCLANQIRLEPEWLLREENLQADFISRIVDYNDWRLDPVVFADLVKRWGPHTIDQFAGTYNGQISCFDSRFLSPGSEAVDAFTCNWGEETN